MQGTRLYCLHHTNFLSAEASVSAVARLEHSEYKKLPNIGTLIILVVIPMNHLSLVGRTLAAVAVLFSEMETRLPLLIFYMGFQQIR